jgi:hypothetical protein
MSTTTQQDYLHEELVIEPPTEFNKMELGEEEWMSIYIPVLPEGLLLQNHYDEMHNFYPKYLHGFIEKVLRIGKIRRIDFVDRQIQNSAMPVKAAFVHFEYWYDTKTARNLREKLNSYGQFRQKGYIHHGKKCNFYSMKAGEDLLTPAYFAIRINHTPIKEVDCDRNVHQLYAENLILERELSKSNDIIAEMQYELNQLQNALTMNGIIVSMAPYVGDGYSTPPISYPETPPILTMEDLAC